MKRNEEQDRYTAALAITELGEGFRINDVSYNPAEDSKPTDDVLFYECAANRNVCEVNNTCHRSTASSYFDKSPEESPLPPLDLTLRKRLTSGAVRAVAIKDEISDLDDSGMRATLPSHQFNEAASPQDRSPTRCSLTTKHPSCRRAMTGDLRSVRRERSELTPIYFCYPLIAVVGVEEMILANSSSDSKSRRDDDPISGTSTSKPTSPPGGSADDGVVKYTPTGLSSIAKFCRENGAVNADLKLRFPAKSRKRSVSVEDATGDPCAKSIAFSHPRGLTSIQEYYRKFNQKPSKSPKSLSCPEPAQESASAELSESSPRPIPLPLSVAEDTDACQFDDFDVENRSIGTVQTYEKRLFNVRSEGLQSTNDGEITRGGEVVGNEISPTPKCVAEFNMEGRSTKESCVANIPIKVLEMSDFEFHSTPAKLKNCSDASTSSPNEINVALSRVEIKGDAAETSASEEADGGGGDWKMLADRQILKPDVDGDFALHVAVSQGDSEMVEHLLHLSTELGGDVNCRDAVRQTPLHIAVEMGFNEIVCRLLEADANPCLPDLRGRACLHLAVLFNNTCALKQILQCPKRLTYNYNIKDYEGLTALHLAVMKGKREACQLLIKSGLVDVNLREGKSGKTALYLSAEHNHPSILDLLMEGGASEKEADYSGYTPYQVALTKQNQEITRIMEERHRRDRSKFSNFCNKNNKKLKLPSYVVA